MFEIHWLSLSAHINFRILILVSKAQLGLAPKYLAGVILRHLSTSWHHLPSSSNRLNLLDPMAQCQAFASIRPSLWNVQSLPTRSQILAGNPSSSFSSLVVLRVGSTSELFTLLYPLFTLCLPSELFTLPTVLYA